LAPIQRPLFEPSLISPGSGPARPALLLIVLAPVFIATRVSGSLDPDGAQLPQETNGSVAGVVVALSLPAPCLG
jgi:hypothetical protein